VNGSRVRILIVGGYGVFGGRLAKLLSDERRLTIIIAGRSKARTKSFCDALPSEATLIAEHFDRDGDLDFQIRQLAPDVVVDTSGPFQGYGEAPYRLVEAALGGGINYLDLADSSDFVDAIGRFDVTAKKRHVFLLSGVSSFPGLTAAVVRNLAQGLKQVDAITGGIAPSPYAGVGPNVVRAVAMYAGKPVSLTLTSEFHLATALPKSCAIRSAHQVFCHLEISCSPWSTSPIYEFYPSNGRGFAPSGWGLARCRKFSISG